MFFSCTNSHDTQNMTSLIMIWIFRMIIFYCCSALLFKKQKTKFDINDFQKICIYRNPQLFSWLNLQIFCDRLLTTKTLYLMSILTLIVWISDKCFKFKGKIISHFLRKENSKKKVDESLQNKVPIKFINLLFRSTFILIFLPPWKTTINNYIIIEK